jgi:hypothetical protein
VREAGEGDFSGAEMVWKVFFFAQPNVKWEDKADVFFLKPN